MRVTHGGGTTNAELPLALERDAISIKTLVKPDGKPNRCRSGAGVRR
jgi:hypothetical protein